MSGHAQRLSFEPLAALIEQRFVPHPTASSSTALGLFCDAVGVAPNTARKWAQMGTISWIWADRVACRLQLHPVTLWPEWYEMPTVAA